MARTPSDPAQELLGDRRSALVEPLAGPDEHGLAVEHGGNGPQPIGFERRSGRDEIANEARDLEARRKLHRALHLDHLGFDALIVEEAPQKARVRGCDALSRKDCGPS